MARTRSLKAKAQEPARESQDDAGTRPKFKLLPVDGEPPKLFILPKSATLSARIVNLPHPRLSRPAKYLVCPQTGIYEFTRIAAPMSTPRSWLLEAAAGSTAENQVTVAADLFVATALDPLFLVLPALAESMLSNGSGDQEEGLFLQSDDHLEKLPQEESHMAEVMRCEATRALIEVRMGAVCDTVEAGDERAFRLNEGKLLEVLVGKARRMARGGLPASMEGRFVKRALEAPLVLKKSEVVGMKMISGGDLSPEAQSLSSSRTPSTAGTDASSISQQPSTAATSCAGEAVGETLVSAMEASPEVVGLQRLRVAFDFICATYVGAALADEMKQRLRAGKLEAGGVDFAPLDEYMASLERLRSETVATSAGDFSRRRRRDEAEEDEREEKRRKLEEAKKKKASESRGVRDLKKVDTSGMKKLSAFFKKK